MKKITLLLFVLLFSIGYGNAQFDNLLKKGQSILKLDKTDPTGNALKEALNFGVNEAVENLSATDGYFSSPYKILVPEEAQAVVSKVSMVPGFGNVEEELTTKMNEAAELAAKEAGPIFVDAIKQMTIKDASSVLFGEQNAATDYLRKTTNQPLYDAFLPVIRKSLEEVNALSYWRTVVSAYNGIPFIKKMNPELDDHVNQKALDGMYALIEKKEAGIRGDSSQRTTDLLKDVFSKQDKKN